MIIAILMLICIVILIKFNSEPDCVRLPLPAFIPDPSKLRRK